MNKKLEELVILVGIMQDNNSEPSVRLKYIEDFETKLAILNGEVSRNRRQFTAAELVIISWLSIVEKAVVSGVELKDRPTLQGAA